MNVRPNGIMPSAEGGIGVMFIEREEYAHVEFDNSGETWVLTYGPNRPGDYLASPVKECRFSARSLE